MHSCELCGKPGSSRQVPLVRVGEGPALWTPGQGVV